MGRFVRETPFQHVFAEAKTAGDFVKVGTVVGMVSGSVSAGKAVAVITEGVVEAVSSVAAIAIGDTVYIDLATQTVNVTAGDGLGVCVEVPATAVGGVCRVLLRPTEAVAAGG